MPEPATPAAVEPAIPAAAPTEVKPAAPVEGEWRTRLSEPLRADPTLLKYKTEEEAHKAHVELARAYGKKIEGMVKMPGAKSTPEEIAAWNKTLGVPDAPDGYSFEIADDLKAMVPQEALDAFRPIFHSIGLPAPLAGKLVQKYAEVMASSRVATQQAYRADQAKQREEIGPLNYDRNLAFAESGVHWLAGREGPDGGWIPGMLGERGGKEFRGLLDKTLLGDHPLMIQAFHIIGKALAEDGHVDIDHATGGSWAQDFIEAAKNPNHAVHKAGPEGEAARAKRRQAYVALYGTEPVTTR